MAILAADRGDIILESEDRAIAQTSPHTLTAYARTMDGRAWIPVGAATVGDMSTSGAAHPYQVLARAYEAWHDSEDPIWQS